MSKEIADRTKRFAVRIIRACTFLDKQAGICRTLSRELLKSGTSIGAAVHEAQFSRSHREVVDMLEIALKEVRETQYWLEILVESDLVDFYLFSALLQEATEIGKLLIESTKKLESS